MQQKQIFFSKQDVKCFLAELDHINASKSNSIKYAPWDDQLELAYHTYNLTLQKFNDEQNADDEKKQNLLAVECKKEGDHLAISINKDQLFKFIDSQQITSSDHFFCKNHLFVFSSNYLMEMNHDICQFDLTKFHDFWASYNFNMHAIRPDTKDFIIDNNKKGNKKKKSTLDSNRPSMITNHVRFFLNFPGIVICALAVFGVILNPLLLIGLVFAGVSLLVSAIGTAGLSIRTDESSTARTLKKILFPSSLLIFAGAGAYAGYAWGAAIGGIFGSIIPGAGTALGIIIGGAIAGLLTGAIVTAAGYSLIDLMREIFSGIGDWISKKFGKNASNSKDIIPQENRQGGTYTGIYDELSEDNMSGKEKEHPNPGKDEHEKSLSKSKYKEGFPNSFINQFDINKKTYYLALLKNFQTTPAKLQKELKYANEISQWFRLIPEDRKDVSKTIIDQILGTVLEKIEKYFIAAKGPGYLDRKDSYTIKDNLDAADAATLIEILKIYQDLMNAYGERLTIFDQYRDEYNILKSTLQNTSAFVTALEESGYSLLPKNE